MKKAQMKKSLILLLLILYVGSIQAQLVNFNRGKIKQKQYFQVIQYQEMIGLAIVPVTINGKTYNFIFDTGAAGLVISDKIFNELSLPVIREIKVGSASAVKKKMKMITVPKLHIQDITFLNIPGLVSNEDFDFVECFGIDGIIGSNMLRNSAIQFDEQNKHIIITNNIKRLLIEKAECQKIHLSFFNSCPYIKITLQKENSEIVNRVLFDSGQSNFYDMSMRNLNGTNIVNTISEGEGSSSFGIHGLSPKQKHLLLNIPQLILNNTTFENVTTQTTQSSHSRIGIQLTHFGKTTLDYKKKLFYFQPYDNIDKNKLSELPWEIGFVIQNDKLVVSIIWDKALEQEINLGDEILSINGNDIQPMDFCKFVELKETIKGDAFFSELLDIKSGEIKKVVIKRLQLIE